MYIIKPDVTNTGYLLSYQNNFMLAIFLSVLIPLGTSSPVHSTNQVQHKAHLSAVEGVERSGIAFLSAYFSSTAQAESFSKMARSYFGITSILPPALDSISIIDVAGLDVIGLSMFQIFGILSDISIGSNIGKWMGKKISGDFGEKVGSIVGTGAVAGVHLATRMNPWALPISVAIRGGLFVGRALYSKFTNPTKQQAGTETDAEQEKVAKTNAEQKKVTKKKVFQEVSQN